MASADAIAMLEISHTKPCLKNLIVSTTAAVLMNS